MFQLNRDRWLKLKSFYFQYPSRCHGALLALAVSIGFIWQQQYMSALIMFSIIIQCLTYHKNQEQWQHGELVEDVFAQIKLQQPMLHVKHRKLPVADIKKVVLDQIDEKYAMIDFPFNVYGKLAMRFPASQLPAIQAWLKQHLPTAQIID